MLTGTRFINQSLIKGALYSVYFLWPHLPVDLATVIWNGTQAILNSQRMSHAGQGNKGLVALFIFLYFLLFCWTLNSRFLRQFSQKTNWSERFVSRSYVEGFHLKCYYACYPTFFFYCFDACYPLLWTITLHFSEEKVYLF